MATERCPACGGTETEPRTRFYGNERWLCTHPFHSASRVGEPEQSCPTPHDCWRKRTCIEWDCCDGRWCDDAPVQEPTSRELGEAGARVGDEREWTDEQIREVAGTIAPLFAEVVGGDAMQPVDPEALVAHVLHKAGVVPRERRRGRSLEGEPRRAGTAQAPGSADVRGSSLARSGA